MCFYVLFHNKLDGKSIKPQNWFPSIKFKQNLKEFHFDVKLNVPSLNFYFDSTETCVQDRGFSVDAPGGAGQTIVPSAFERFLRAKGKNIVTVASATVAAQLPNDGQTINSALQVPISLHQDSTRYKFTDSSLAEDFRQKDFII